MSKIDPRLFTRLKDKLGLSDRRVYELVEAKARSANLERHLAAVALANEQKINTSRYVTKEDLAVLREAARSAPVAALRFQQLLPPQDERPQKNEQDPRERGIPSGLFMAVTRGPGTRYLPSCALWG